MEKRLGEMCINKSLKEKVLKRFGSVGRMGRERENLMNLKCSNRKKKLISEHEDNVPEKLTIGFWDTIN